MKMYAVCKKCKEEFEIELIPFDAFYIVSIVACAHCNTEHEFWLRIEPNIKG